MQRPPRYALLDTELKKCVQWGKLNSLAIPLTEEERALALRNNTQKHNTTNVRNNMLDINVIFGAFQDRVIDKKEPEVSFITDYSSILQKQGKLSKKVLIEARKAIHQYYEALRNLEWAIFKTERDPNDETAKKEKTRCEQAVVEARDNILNSQACETFFDAIEKLNEEYPEKNPEKRQALKNNTFFERLTSVFGISENGTYTLMDGLIEQRDEDLERAKTAPKLAPVTTPSRTEPHVTKPLKEPAHTLTPLAEAHDVLPYIKHTTPEMMLKPQEPSTVPPEEVPQRFRRLSDSLRAASAERSPKALKKSEHIDIELSEQENEISFKWNPPDWKTEARDPLPNDVQTFVKLARKAAIEAAPLTLEFTIQGFRADDAATLYKFLREEPALEVRVTKKQLEVIRTKPMWDNMTFDEIIPQEEPSFRPSYRPPHSG